MTSKIDKLKISNELKDKYIKKLEKELEQKQLVIDKVFYYANRSNHKCYCEKIFYLVQNEVEEYINYTNEKEYGVCDDN